MSDSVCSATTEAQVADVRPAGICNWAQEGDSSSQGHTSKPEQLALKSLIIFSISITNLFYFERILQTTLLKMLYKQGATAQTDKRCTGL